MSKDLELIMFELRLRCGSPGFLSSAGVGLGVRKTRVQVLLLIDIGSVTLEKSLNLKVL